MLEHKPLAFFQHYLFLIVDTFEGNQEQRLLLLSIFLGLLKEAYTLGEMFARRFTASEENSRGDPVETTEGWLSSLLYSSISFFA